MTVRVLQVSDIHLSERPPAPGSPDPQDRLDVVLAAAVTRFGTPDLVVASGDLTDDGSASACARLARRLAALGAPVLAVPGNHDDPAAVSASFGPPDVVIGGWRIVGVDSSRRDQVHGSVDVAEVLDRLDAEDPLPTLVVLHHPPASPSTHEWFRLDGGAQLVAGLAERAHVEAVLSGHLHEPFETALGGVPVLGAPSTWIGIRHDGDRYEVGVDGSTGARWLDLVEGGTFRTTLLQA